jgi:hypothetical protein
MAKKTNNDLQNIRNKTKNRVTQTPLKSLIEVKLVQHEDVFGLLWSYHAAASVSLYCLIILLLTR